MQSQQTLELRQRQQLALTPGLQQSIRFLQLSALELKQELAQAVLENPMLESEAEYDIDEAVSVESEAPSLTADLGEAGGAVAMPTAMATMMTDRRLQRRKPCRITSCSNLVWPVRGRAMMRWCASCCTS